MPTAYEEATALAQQYVADRMGAMQARIDELEAAQQGAGYGMMPAPGTSGAHYSSPGSYEGYRDYGFDPVLYQRRPYATATTRVFNGPNGQLGVQPLIGFPSAYPHVIQYPGDNPFREMPNLVSLAQALWGALPMPPMMPMRGGVGVGGGASRGGNTAPTVGTRKRGDPYEPDGAVYGPLPPAPASTASRVVPQGEPPAQYTGPIRDANGRLLNEAMRRDENTFLGFASPWFGADGGVPATNTPGVYSNMYDEPSTFEHVWDWVSGAGKPTPDELNAEYNAALRHQSPAVMRAAQQAFQQDIQPPVALTQLAAPVPSQLPPIAPLAPPSRNPTLIDAVNQSIR